MTKLTSLSLFALIAFAPSISYAAPVTVQCPGTVATTDREFSVTTDPGTATCVMYEDAADSGDDNGLQANGSDLMVLDGWEVIDKDEDPDEAFPNDAWFSIDGVGGTSGDFTISALAWAAYDRIAIGFKVGGGSGVRATHPTWAVFELPEDTLLGDWLTSHSQALSHANLYGFGDGDNEITSVPEPASMLLVGAGLSVLARRRRNRATK